MGSALGLGASPACLSCRWWAGDKTGAGWSGDSFTCAVPVRCFLGSLTSLPRGHSSQLGQVCSNCDPVAASVAKGTSPGVWLLFRSLLTLCLLLSHQPQQTTGPSQQSVGGRATQGHRYKEGSYDTMLQSTTHPDPKGVKIWKIHI